jgi:hypothetical protein
MKKMQKRASLFLSIVLGGIVLICLSACGGGADTDNTASVDTGAVAFRVVFQDAASAGGIRQARAPSGDICEDYLIETIAAYVYSASNEIVASDSWDCDTPGHTGTISGVPAGTGMYVVVGGFVAGDTGYPDWKGESEPFALSAGQSVDAGLVSMSYWGDDSDPPDIHRTTPVNQDGDVPLNTIITATFTEDVITASLISTFSLTGATTVAGTATYNTSEKTVSFRPDVDLDENTEYTATIAGGVEDRAGNQMINDYSWSFTTAQEGDSEPPSIPTLLSATAASDSAIDLSWEAASDNFGVINYHVYRDGGFVKSVTGTSTTDSNLSPDTRYCYQVSALDAAQNESGLSNEICERTLLTAPPPAPMLSSPQNGAILDNNCDDLSDSIEWDFDWSDVADATKYQIYVIGSNTTPIIDTEVTSSSYSYTDSGYIADANRLNYTWMVRAGNADGWSEWSEERNFDVEPLNTDCLPTDVIWDESNDGDFSNIDATPTDLLMLSPGKINEIHGSIGRFSSSDTADVVKFTVPAGYRLTHVILSAYDDIVYYDYVPFTLYNGLTADDSQIEFMLLNESGAGTDLLQFDSMPGPQPAGVYSFKFGSIQQNAVSDERSLYTVLLVVQ